MAKYRAVVIGAGTIAKIHLKTLHGCPRTELAAVADINACRAEQSAEEYRIKAYSDYKEMVRQERPDLAVITLPHYLHKEAAVHCVSNGCHVLVEKPMAMNVQECTEMNEAARTNGKTIAVGHMQHYYPVNMIAKEIIRSGRLGKLVMMLDRRWSDYFLPSRPAWFLDRAQSGGGIVINIGSHSIDKVQWLTGDRIAKVKAHMTYYGERGDVEGSAQMLLSTSQGVTASVSLCGYRNSPAYETELLFTGGQLKIEGSHTLWMSEGERATYEKVDTSGCSNAFEAQWNDVLDAIENGTELGISGGYGQSVAAVVAAAYRSHETGREEDVQPHRV